MVDMICQACGKKFSVKPYRALTARFCSCSCWTKSNESKSIVSKTTTERMRKNPRKGEENHNWKERIVNECKNCGKDFPTLPCRQRLFCCHKCSEDFLLGEHSVHWKGGITPRTVTLEWKKIREGVFERDFHTCKYCGSTRKIIAHHKIPVRYGGKDVLENLETVCNVCHPRVEKSHAENLQDEAISLKCEECMNEYIDGRRDCEIPLCPLYPYMPYKGTGVANG